VPGFIRAALAELVLGCALLAAGVMLAASDHLVSPFAAVFVGAACFAILWIWRQTRHTFRLTRELQEVRDSDPLPIVRELRSATAHACNVSPIEQ